MQLELRAPSAAAPRPSFALPASPDRRFRQELRHAAQTGGFTLAFQPRRDLLRDVPIGAAVQLRWPRKRGGISQASAFMPLLQAYGLAAGVAAWALNEACKAASAWPHGQVCVAADTGTLRDGTLLRLVGQALDESGLPPDRLEIEFSEPALAADTCDVLFTLAALRDLGVGIALDAFGSESASLLPLKRLPLTALKLDRSLIRDLPDDREAEAIVRAATDFAHALDVTVVACGLETDAQLAFLRRINCDEAQGSLCGRAVGAGEMAAGLVR